VANLPQNVLPAPGRGPITGVDAATCSLASEAAVTLGNAREIGEASFTVSSEPLDTSPRGTFPPVATRAVEALLFAADRRGDAECLYPRNREAWSLELPSLADLLRREGHQPGGARRRLRFCIATEDIVGPVRNGGIGTTYAYLARTLGKAGHDVTILYLKGTDIENESLDYWVEDYARDGVRFVPVPSYWRADGMVGTAAHWQAPMYDMYRWLQANPMDVVHVSEWRGSGYLSLLAKHQGLAFAETLFIVKTSSPWLWNRLYGSHGLERAYDLTLTWAERRSVELADMVVGGSLHLLRWMASQGYALPEGRTFVQPNVVDFSHLTPLVARRSLAPGSRLPIEEIVFFGRLEARKGVLVFLQTIRRMIRLGMKLPPRIAFMGKPGQPLGVRPGQTVLEAIAEETRDWPLEVVVHTGFQQFEAIDYLLSGNRLAVMPSTIENSSLAVYEAALCHIPFVASDTGGTAELIAAEDHAEVLCDAHPVPLATLLGRAMEKGGHIARPSFANETNLATWQAFHAGLEEGLHGVLVRRRQPATTAQPASTSVSPPAPAPIGVQVCLHARGADADLTHTLRALAEQTLPPQRVSIAVDGTDVAGVRAAAADRLTATGIAVEVVEALDWDMGLAWNRAAEAAEGEALLFLEQGALLVPEALAVLTASMRSSGSQAVTFFCAEADRANGWAGAIVGEAIGSPGELLVGETPFELPLLVMRETFRRVGGFSTDYGVLLAEREWLAKAMLAGARVETVPRVLGSRPRRAAHWLAQNSYDPAAARFRVLRPFLAALPLALREPLLVLKGLQGRQRGGRLRTFEIAPDATASSRDAEAEWATILAAMTRWAAIEGAGGAALRPPPGDHVTMLDGWRGADVADAARYRGGVLDARRGVVAGWVVARDAPTRALTVEARIDGKTVARAVADRALEGVVGVPASVRGHGFSLDVLSRWSPATWSGQSARCDVVLEDGTVLARDLEVRGRDAPLAGSGLAGFCDPSDAGIVQGWLWSPADPARRHQITVYVDGALLDRRTADTFRLDLQEAGIGDGAYGFFVRLPERLVDGRRRTVEVLVADRGLLLPGAPLAVEGRKVTRATRARPLLARAASAARARSGGRRD
jgi:glycosyltransferase involved in cell wall biosynthesis